MYFLFGKFDHLVRNERQDPYEVVVEYVPQPGVAAMPEGGAKGQVGVDLRQGTNGLTFFKKNHSNCEGNRYLFVLKHHYLSMLNLPASWCWQTAPLTW